MEMVKGGRWIRFNLVYLDNPDGSKDNLGLLFSGIMNENVALNGIKYVLIKLKVKINLSFQ